MASWFSRRSIPATPWTTCGRAWGGRCVCASRSVKSSRRRLTCSLFSVILISGGPRLHNAMQRLRISSCILQAVSRLCVSAFTTDGASTL